MDGFADLMINETNATSGPVVPACWPVLIDPTTTELLDALGGNSKFLGVMGTAIALTVFNVGMYMETLWFLCRKIPSRRKIQLSFIMGIYPVFSVTSLLAMFIPRASIITGFTAHVYFSMALVQFIMLLTGYYGDKAKMLRILDGNIIPLATPPLSLFCICCLPKIPINKVTLPKFVKLIRGLVLQVAVIKPLFYFLGAVLWLNGSFIPGDFSSTGTYLWFNVIYIVSTLFALNGIIIFYKLSREPLKEYHLTPKFFTVQLTLILTNVQSFTIGLCAIAGNIACKPPFHPGLRALYIDSLLNIVEMFLFNIFATVWYRRLKGNIGQEQLLERREYARLSQNSYRRDPAQQIALGDENDNKTDLALYKPTYPDATGIVTRQNGGSSVHAQGVGDTPWQQFGDAPAESELKQPFLHVAADSQPNGSVACRVTDETLNHHQSPPHKNTVDDTVERGSIKSGSIPWSGSGSDRETDV
ncbi:organic solute transporter subunit alpha [Strongylocentrotus purpuratus]|uniref:Organic solute transporter Ostalpha-domain-containing protein n=1 Tax=Strongylocentrotus purpuratus TaxID=7668 RepID=A0A7M7GGZ8_STRPU|nr:organic solute transporter subunit alpha [Strongylocentrotus purpuratus]